MLKCLLDTQIIHLWINCKSNVDSLRMCYEKRPLVVRKYVDNLIFRSEKSNGISNYRTILFANLIYLSITFKYEIVEKWIRIPPVSPQNYRPTSNEVSMKQ